MPPNHQRIGKDRGAERASFGLRGKWSRASFPSVGEPARSAGWRFRRLIRRYAFCFLGGSMSALVEDPLKDVAGPGGLRRKPDALNQQRHGSWALKLDEKKA